VDVALKALRPERLSSAKARELLRQEVRSARERETTAITTVVLSLKPPPKIQSGRRVEARFARGPRASAE
jgi:hypothetical protein